MLFKDITIIDEEYQVREHMYVGVKNDRIACVSAVMPEEDYGEVYDGAGKLLLPAFYNAHSHLSMVLMRGYSENLPLMNWLNGKIFPFESHLTPDDIYYSTMFGAAEMLRYGIAGTNDMYLDVLAGTRALVDSGVRANSSACAVWMDNSRTYYDLPVYRDTLEAMQRYNAVDGGRVRAMFSLHAEYTSTEAIAKAVAEATADNHSLMHVHVAESQGEVDLCRKRHQRRSPVRYLADCGIFDVPAVAAHCVHLDDNDIQILKDHNVTVATCAKGNAKLSSGICPVTALLEAGVNVAIGTDSVASNNNLNMLEEMRFFNLLQKVNTFDPTVITPAETLHAATRAGALAMQWDDCGFVKEGFKADLTVLKIDPVTMMPVHNLLNNLIYSASGSDIVLTMVDGRVRYRDGNYPDLDIERIRYEVEKTRNRILGCLNAPVIPDIEIK